MFCFSWNWLWAQCLAIAAGLFLLSYMAVPGGAHRSQVAGTIAQIETTSRKGKGALFELTVREADGGTQAVLIADEVAPEPAVRALVGREIVAEVNWSGEAVAARIVGGSADFDRNAGQAAQRRHAGLAFMGTIAIVLGIVLGIARLTGFPRND